MNNTGLGASVFLTALGAVMAWAVTVEAEGFNINTAGLILFAVGIAGILGSLALGSMGNKTVVERDRDVVVESK